MRIRRRSVVVALAAALALGAAALAGPAASARSGTPAASSGSTLRPPVTVGPDGNEPIVAVAPDGTLYVSALEFLYVSRDGGKTWFQSPGAIYNGQLYQQRGLNLASDSSISVDPAGRLYFTFNYPYAGVVAVCTSDDRAQHLSCNPDVLPGGNDRQWIYAPTTKAAYLTTNEGLYHTLFFQSTDRGANWSPTKSTDSLLNPNDGPIVRSPKTGLLYQPFVDNASNLTATDEEGSGPIVLHVWHPSSSSPTPASEIQTPLVAGAGLTDAAFTPNGTLYVVSEGVTGTDASGAVTGKDVLVARSTDGGASWTVLPPIPGTTKGTSAFAWIAAGSNGHVGVIYYRTPVGGRADSADGTWDLLWAETRNGNAATPTWSVRVLDAAVHTGPICSTAGCSGSNRFAGDFISAAFDSLDRPHLSWVRDLGPDANGDDQTEVRYSGP
jgi:BNR/Asp-box repeat